MAYCLPSPSPPIESDTLKSKPRPLMLKDFLREDPNSWSNDFSSFPRRRRDTTVRQLLEIDLNSRNLRRSRSSAAAAATISSALHKASEAVISAVKHLQPFSPSRSPALHQSLSRSLRRGFWKRIGGGAPETRSGVQVHDVKRWRSFGDEEEEKQACSSSSSRSGGGGSSWAESDFTSSGCGSECSAGGEAEEKRRRCVGEGCKEAKGEENRGHLESSYEEKEQLSPISVLDFLYEDEEEDVESPSSFPDSLTNMESTKQKLLQKIRRFECIAQLEPVDLEQRIAQSELEEAAEVEEVLEEDRAVHLPNHMEAGSENALESSTYNLLVDFFREGLVSPRKSLTEQQTSAVEKELLRTACDWLNNSVAGVVWGVYDHREVCMNELASDRKWTSFKKEEEEQIATETEIGVLSSLVEELIFDLLD